MKVELAINGGQPVRNEFLSYGKQSIEDDDIQAVVDILKGDYLTTGPTISEFEKAVAEYIGSKYAVAVSNGTAALHMACFAAGISEGDEVLVPAITFAATSNAVLYCKGKPVFVDINPKTLNIDLDKIEEKITDKTKAIMPVHFAGQSVDMDKINKIAKEHNLLVIEDGAHALGGLYKGEKVGKNSDLIEFSFHPVKPVTTGEGGVVATNSKELYEKMLQFRTHGITRDSDKLINLEGPWYYEMQDLGFNYRMTDIQAALGISQMKKIDRFIKRRREIVDIYNKELNSIEEIEIPFEEEFSKSGYHIYVIKLNQNKLKCSRREIFEALIKENIGVNVHYLPVYLHPYYRSLGYEKGICKVSEDVYDRIITLPLFPSMNDKDVHDVINGLKKVIEYYKK